MKEICVCARDRLIRIACGFAPRIVVSIDEDVLMTLEREEQGWRIYDALGEPQALLSKEAMALSVGGEQVLVMMQERRTKLYFHRVGTFSIGRSEQCALVLKESFISLFHAELCSADGALLLKDLGSTNGTYVNERRAGQVQLKAGDVVDLLAMRIIIGAGFVAADRPLPLLRYVPAALPDVPPNAEPCVKWLSSPLSVRTMELPPLPQLSPPAFQPLALQLGVGMTMALFSLLAYSRSSSGMWMAWGMAFSMVVWPLLNALYQRHAHRRQIREKRLQFEKRIASRQQEALAHAQALRESGERWKQALMQPQTLLMGAKTPWLMAGTADMPAIIWSRREEEDHPFASLLDQLTQTAVTCEKMPLLCQASASIWLLNVEDSLVRLVLMQMLKQRPDAEVWLCQVPSPLIGRLRLLKQGHHRAVSLAQAVRASGHGTRIVLCDELAADSSRVDDEVWVIVLSTGRRRPPSDALVIDGKSAMLHAKETIPVFLSKLSDERWDDFLQRMASRECVHAPRPTDFLSLFSCSSCAQLQAEMRWKRQRLSGSLAAVLGWDEQGDPIVLDAHEKADGPHGILAGMTGSGKSELLLSYILSLSCSCSPETVSFFLIDYKGGSMVSALRRLPHLCGMMTNLDEASLQRVRISLNREITMRQEQFWRMMSEHHLSSLSIAQYQQLCDGSYVPLGHLFIIVDEFAQLREEHAQFLDELRRAARIGRSLGIHLLLCTQKPGGIIDEQIRSNARFRICMKVQSRADSRDMLQGDEALALRNAGEFILQVGDGEKSIRGVSAYVNADYCPQARTCAAHLLQILDQEGRTHSALRWQDADGTQKQLGAVVDHLCACAEKMGMRARQICAPELPQYAECPPKESMQLGWRDCPQRQCVMPLSIKGRSFLAICPPQEQERFLLCCGAAIAQEEGIMMFDLSHPQMKRERMLAQLIHVLSQIQREAYLLADDPSLFHDARYASALHALLRRPMIHLMVLMQECDHALMSRLPAGMGKMSYAVHETGLLQEFFGQTAGGVLLRHPGCGIVADEEGLSAYICLRPDPRCYARCIQDSMAELMTLSGRSIGVDVSSGSLFFWPKAEMVIVLCAQETQCARFAQKVRSWCTAHTEVAAGWAEDPQIRALADAHRHDALFCWMGSGADVHGFRFGFRALRCGSTQMIVRHGDEEQLIQLWTEEG